MAIGGGDEEEIEVPGDTENGGPGTELPVQRDFPDAFYDPSTGNIMVDPVVNSAGDSYERSSVIDTISAVTYYPNRALQAIIRHETDMAVNTVGGSIRRLHATIQSGWGRLLEKSAFPSNYKPLPDAFYCPITCELMVDPLISPDGNSYEGEAIENWIQSNAKSPLTRDPLTLAEIRPNNALYDLIQTEKKRTLETMHPSIRRWKESTAATSRRPATVALGGSTGITSVPLAPPAQDQPHSPPLNVYPTTEAELDERRRQQGSIRCSIWIIYFSILVLFVVFPVGISLCLIALLTCCCVAASNEPIRPS